MPSPRILLLHGPNLNLLGSREPSVYGTSSLDDYAETVRQAAKSHDFNVETFQSNSEAEVVGVVQGATGTYEAIIVNAGALTHYSWALHDALRSFSGPIVEVHISNPTAREGFRHVSVMASVVSGSISGFGGLGYVLAVEALARLLPPR